MPPLRPLNPVRVGHWVNSAELVGGWERPGPGPCLCSRQTVSSCSTPTVVSQAVLAGCQYKHLLVQPALKHISVCA